VEIQISIRELSVGSVAIIVGYSRVYGGYIGKLLAKGLTPGKVFVVLDTTLSEGRVAILLKEKISILSKPETDALCVEPAIGEEE
jgi:ferrous iron transport protein A